MKTAQKILMIVAGVVSIFMIITWGICAGMFFAGANNTEVINDYTADHANVTEEAVKVVFVSLGVMFAIFAVGSVANAIVAFKAINTSSKGLLIANIVFGVISGVTVNIVGAIFGLIARNMNKPKQAEEI